MTRGEASGKVILLGEHAVVYGHPAIAAAISRKVRVTAEPAAEWSLELPGMKAPAEIVEAAKAIAATAQPHRVRVESEIPLGGGLGSSAALGVAIARAFGAADAAQAAMRLETVLHGAPSGVDPYTCAQDGLILFARGDPPRVERLNAELWIVVAPTGISRGTRTTVMPLSERRKREPAKIDAIMKRIDGLVHAAVAAIMTGKLVALGGCMRENQAALRELGVSCPELEQIVQRLNDAGALGAKLTGAGGGGSAIALAQDEAHARSIAAQVPGSFVEHVR